MFEREGPRTEDGYPVNMPYAYRETWKEYIDSGYDRDHGIAKVQYETFHNAEGRWPAAYFENEYNCKTQAQIDSIKSAMRHHMQVLMWVFSEYKLHCQVEAAQRAKDKYSFGGSAYGDRESSNKLFEGMTEKAKWKKIQNARVVLGVWTNDDQATVKKAYRQKSLQHHPDTGGSGAKFISIKWAFDTICKDRGWD